MARTTVGILGLDERTANALDFFFKNRLDARYAIGAPESADLLIIDLDSYGGREAWERETQARPERPIVVLSVAPGTAEGADCFVRKPLQSPVLVAALDQASAKLPIAEPAPLRDAPKKLLEPWQRASENAVEEIVERSPRIPSNPPATRPTVGTAGFRLEQKSIHSYYSDVQDIDPADEKQVAKVQYDPDAYLIGRLKRAFRWSLEQGRPVQLDLPRGRIVVMGPTGTAMADMHHSQLRALAVMVLPDSSVKARMLDAFDPSGVPAEKIFRLDALLWATALLASRGRVPLGTDLKAKVVLKHWPNLTRLQAFPYELHMESSVRISSFLARGGTSLIVAAKELRVPQRHVFSFFAAAVALDLVEQREAAVAAEVREPAPRKNRGLFKRILSHLRG